VRLRRLKNLRCKIFHKHARTQEVVGCLEQRAPCSKFSSQTHSTTAYWVLYGQFFADGMGANLADFYDFTQFSEVCVTLNITHINLYKGRNG
jgi:hypothetical protein